MRLPLGLARFNKHVTNRISGLFAARVPPFAFVIHRGRTTGKIYRTPIMCWRSGSVITIALTYGPNIDWLKNLRADNGGAIERAGVHSEVGPPRSISTEEGLARMPRYVHLILWTVGLEDFIELAVTGDSRI